MQQILIIGADISSSKKLKYALQGEKTGAYYALSPDDGIRHLAHYGYQLVVVDIDAPIPELLKLMERVRKVRFTSILVLSSIGDSDSIVQTLSVADDFLQKPYDINICRARIQSLLRRPTYNDPQDAPGVLSKDGTLLIDSRSRKVYALEVEVPLPRKQYDLLYLLASNEGRVFTHEQLYRNIWGYDYFDSSNVALSCQIRKLRRTLESVPGAPQYIVTIRGVGYRFDTNAQ